MNELMILINIYCDNLCVLLAAIYTEQQLWPDLISSSYSLLHFETTDTQTHTHIKKYNRNDEDSNWGFAIWSNEDIFTVNRSEKNVRAKSEF